jgi:hypothetical protein
MKRITALFIIIFLFALNTEAAIYIKRTVMGFQLGSAKKEQVASGLLKKGYKCKAIGGNVDVDNISFGGLIWNYSLWEFDSDGTLYSVSFIMEFANKEEANSIRNRIGDNLLIKYPFGEIDESGSYSFDDLYMWILVTTEIKSGYEIFGSYNLVVSYTFKDIYFNLDNEF